MKFHNKTVWLKYLALVLAFSVVFTTKVFADGDADCVDTVDTVLFGTVCGSEGISKVLELVINVLNIGVGILGVIGISVTGIQYLTAGSSEEQTKKAKRRLTEIVIGLAAYAVLSVFVNFLTGTTSTTAELANISSISSSSFSGGNSVAGKGKWVKSGKKVYYEGENGQKAKGRQKINGANYYFDQKTGAMKTGFVTEKKNGKTSYYYFKASGKDKGKQVFGTAKIYGPYNGTKTKDTWYFNKKTGKLEGVKLAVKRQQQIGGCGCGPTSMAIWASYVSGRNYDECDIQCFGISDCGGCYSCNDPGLFGDDPIYYSSALRSTLGFTVSEKVSPTKEQAVNRLFGGTPFIFQAPPPDNNPLATEMGFTAGAGHFLVVSGYYKNNFIFQDPADRISTASWNTMNKVSFIQEGAYRGSGSFHFFKLKKKKH